MFCNWPMLDLDVMINGYSAALAIFPAACINHVQSHFYSLGRDENEPVCQNPKRLPHFS